MTDVVFFPFSHLGKQQCRTLLTFFSRVRFLSMAAGATQESWLAELTDRGAVKPLFTSATDLAAIEARIQSYLEWVKIHRGNERNLKALLKDNPYFMDDSGLTGIKSQLHRRLHGGQQSGVDAREDSDTAATDPLLFLKFAQMADAENEKIDAELQHLEKSRASLFSTLKGEAKMEIPGLPATAPSDPGRSMTGARIRNWLGVARQRGLFPGEGELPLLVTTSQAVFDRLESIFGEGINALDIDSIKVHEDGCEQKPQWQEHLSEALWSILETPAKWERKLPQALYRDPGGCSPEECHLTGRIKLAVFREPEGETGHGLGGKQVAACLVELKA